MYVDRDDFVAWMERIMDNFERIEKKVDRLSNVRNCLDGEQLLDNQDLMMITKMSSRTLQRYRKKGTLPYINKDGKNFYRASDVHKFIREKL
ncbi:MAG: DNA-binding protein [Bacteroidia bacterium]|nr:DNA-binding protein [Bacteroidia bacterium]